MNDDPTRASSYGKYVSHFAAPRRRLAVLILVSILALAPFAATPSPAADVTLIHMGDLHGHLVPHPSIHPDAQGKTEGGLARMYTRIEEIRARRGRAATLLLNTGDTIQGSAEALFTRGQALVDVLNRFGIDAYTPGNWDWVYGVVRVADLFGGAPPEAPWTALAANAYYDGDPYADRKGERVLPPYVVREVNGVRVGILGFTTDRGPQVVGRAVTQGVRFTKGDEEVPAFVRLLREEERVALVVMISELGIANNIRIAEATPGIDVILSADMHEISRDPVITRTGTLVIEAGQDGQVLGELNLRLQNDRLAGWTWTLHRIDERLRPHPAIDKAVADVRRPFLSGAGFRPQVNPFNGTTLTKPIDTVVGQARVPLHRANATDSAGSPAVIEGSSHRVLTSAFRAETQADIGAIRGFRYGTVVRPGPIRLEDLYHFIPIGPQIAKGTVKGRQIINQIEASADGSLNADVAKWTGGWLFVFAGLRIDLDPYAPAGSRVRRIAVMDRATHAWKPLDPNADYTYASYYYARDPGFINAAPAADITILKDKDGRPLDAVDVVVRYLERQPGKVADPGGSRVTLTRPLPAPRSGSPEIQPWRGIPTDPQVARRSAPQPALADAPRSGP